MSGPQQKPPYDTSNCGEMCGAMRAWTKCSKTLKAQETRDMGRQESKNAGLELDGRPSAPGEDLDRLCNNKLVVREKCVRSARLV